jgi:hypothetical protein
LVLGELLFVAAQEFADGVDTVALAGPAAMLLPDEAPAQVSSRAPVSSTPDEPSPARTSWSTSPTAPASESRHRPCDDVPQARGPTRQDHSTEATLSFTPSFPRAPPRYPTPRTSPPADRLQHDKGHDRRFASSNAAQVMAGLWEDTYDVPLLAAGWSEGTPTLTGHEARLCSAPPASGSPTDGSSLRSSLGEIHSGNKPSIETNDGKFLRFRWALAFTRRVWCSVDRCGAVRRPGIWSSKSEEAGILRWRLWRSICSYSLVRCCVDMQDKTLT